MSRVPEEGPSGPSRGVDDLAGHSIGGTTLVASCELVRAPIVETVGVRRFLSRALVRLVRPGAGATA